METPQRDDALAPTADALPAEDGPVERLAAEFLERESVGEEPDLDDYAARLDDPAQREDLRATIEAAHTAERHLPGPLTSRSVLADRYRILEQIGQGGMGRVFSAWDQDLKRRVAVKVLSALDAGDDERREMFLKESRLLASLQHPNIVAVHEAGRDEEYTFIVMDLVDGRSLADVIERARRELETATSDTKLVPRDGDLFERAIGRPVPDGRESLIDTHSWHMTAARIAHELALTLEAAHGRKVVHRDLKPQNVMLLGGANPVVLDFGLAGSLEVTDGAVTQGLYGSVAYLAPEQVTSFRVGNDPRTDIYQMGLILYEMVTLRRAFPGQAMGEILDRIKNSDYKPARQWNSAIPIELAAICHKALELDPEQRYQTATELREDLDRFLGGEESPLAMSGHHVRGAARRVRATARRHPGLLAAAGMIGVALLATLLFTPEATYAGQTFSVGADTFTYVRDDDPVEPGEMLGVEIEASTAGFVYAFSIAGDSPSKRYVRPVHATTADLGPRYDEARYSLDVPKGMTRVLCKDIPINPETDRRFAREGLLVLVSETPRPDLERWMNLLAEKIDLGFIYGVPYEDATDMYQTVRESRVRGETIEAPDTDRWERLKHTLRQVDSQLVQQWKAGSWKPFAVECRVVEGRQ